MSKKILSLALVVIMLFSICVISTNAAVADGCEIGLRVESNAVVGAPAGTSVEVKIYYTVPADFDASSYMHALSPLALAFNNEVYAIDSESTEQNKNDARTFGASYVDIFKDTSALTYSSTMTNNIANKCSADEVANYGWNDGCMIQQLYASGIDYNAKTGYPIDPDCEVVTVRFVTLKTLTAADVIGCPVNGLGQSWFKMNYFNGKGTSAYAATAVDLSTAIAAPVVAAEPTVEHWDTMGQMGNWETLTGKFNGGLVGKISNLDLAFDGNECTNLLKIEVALTTATGSSKAEAYQVYEQTDGSYLFRAVIKDMDITSEANISAVYTIYVDTDADGEADKTYSSEAVDVNAKAIYKEALDNYKAA